MLSEPTVLTRVPGISSLVAPFLGATTLRVIQDSSNE